MKHLTVILLLGAFLMQSFSQTWILAVFSANKNYIANNLCVNRFVPMSGCGGNCVLSKKMKESQQQQEKFPDLKQNEVPLFYNTIIHLQHPDKPEQYHIKPPLRNVKVVADNHTAGLLRPPRFFIS